jgi:hypothetical protein
MKSILKFILQKYGAKKWMGPIWLKAGSSGRKFHDHLSDYLLCRNPAPCSE